jgi:hypothetical protein
MNTQVWMAPTYWDALVAGGVTEPLPIVPVKHSFLQRVQCSCGAQVWPQEMLDVGALDSAITGDRRFVCSGEVALWLDSRDVPLNRIDLISTLGAPPAHIAAITQRENEERTEK